MHQFVNQQLQETVTHGTTLLPIQIYLNQQINPQLSLYTHWHDKLEILACRSGSFDMTIETETFRVHAGEYIIVNQALLHAAKAHNGQNSSHDVLIFDLKLLTSQIYDFAQSQFLDPLLQKQVLFPQKLTRESAWGARCCQEFDEIFAHYAKQRLGWELSVKANLLKVISLLFLEDQFIANADQQQQFKHEKSHMLKTSIDYLQQQMAEKVSIPDLARLINVSPEYFCRFFKQHTGMTAIEYVHHLRIERAVNLLLNTDLSVLAISLQVGFEDQSYFSKKFKLAKGTTPAQFRKQHLRLD